VFDFARVMTLVVSRVKKPQNLVVLAPQLAAILGKAKHGAKKSF
jgi:hypothetical protein